MIDKVSEFQENSRPDASLTLSQQAVDSFTPISNTNGELAMASSDEQFLDFSKNDIFGEPLAAEGELSEGYQLDDYTKSYMDQTFEDIKGGNLGRLLGSVEELNSITDPDDADDWRRGLGELSSRLAESGVTANLSDDGKFSMTLPAIGGERQSLTIDQDGITNLQGPYFREFESNLRNVIQNKGEPAFSAEARARGNGMLTGIRKNDLSSLADSITQIGQALGSTGGGDAGAAEQKTARELQDILSTMSDMLDTSNVDANYDRESNSFSVRLQNGNGAPDKMLQIDKFGRANLNGEQLQGFMQDWKAQRLYNFLTYGNATG